MKKHVVTIFVALFVILFFQPVYPSTSNYFNFSFLESQKKTVRLANGKEFSVWMSPCIKDDSSSFIGRTEDIASVALMYLSYYEKSNEADILKRAHDALLILFEMQDEKGLFYPSLKNDGTIEISSQNTFDFSTAVSFLAIAHGIKTYYGHDNSFLAVLKDRFSRTLNRLLELNSSDSGATIKKIHNVDVPQCLINGRSDLTSIFVLALLEYYSVFPDENIKKVISCYCDAICSFQGNSYKEYPFCAHYADAENLAIWRIMHSRQISALSLAGLKFGNKTWIESAEREVNGLYTHFIASYGPMCAMSPAFIIYPQNSQSIDVVTSNLLNLYKATGKENYEVLAGLFASWIFGGNTKKETMYDRLTGKCFDYIDEKGKSQSTGVMAAASILSSLTALLNTEGWKYLEYRDKVPPFTFLKFEAEDGKAVRKDYEIEEVEYPGGSSGKYVVVKRENSFWVKMDIAKESEYDFFLVYLMQTGFNFGSSIMMRVDGDKIFTVSLTGSDDAPYMVMKEVLEPRLLQSGLHSLGIRYSGLLHSKAAVIDTVILQPVFEWRIMNDSKGHIVSVLKSFSKEEKDFEMNRMGLEKTNITSLTVYSKTGDAIIRFEGLKSNPDLIKLPAFGYAIIKGKS